MLIRYRVFRFLQSSCWFASLASAVFWNSAMASLAAEAPPAEKTADKDLSESDPQAAAAKEAELITNGRQLTFDGRRAGEGYFSADGRRMVFQSEREPGNPFFQIYLLDLETGDTERVSPGYGKTTCAWIHPQGNQVLYASTHEDAKARDKQQEELKLRESGQERRYAWDYDEHYEIYQWDRKTGQSTNLTKTLGYDAEGSYSPDGKLIAFTSNRRAYGNDLTEEERKAFAQDPATLNDIYRMDADGSHVQRLTTAPGYDGGPFFAPDGRRICWRRFTPDGVRAEIMTMLVDGSDQRPLTHLGMMSWAPFYHPSGEYLIFTTNRHGFANFELYLVDTEGKSAPVRVTYTAGFDGLPVFTPDGQHLAWTSNRTASKQSQIFFADWNDQRARELLGLGRDAGQTRAAPTVPPSTPPAADEANTATARAAAAEAGKQTTADFSPQDVRRHVDYLCRPELAGRLTGTEGERLATAYVAAYLDGLGLKPAGDDGTWFQKFEFTSGVALGEKNSLAWGDKSYRVHEDWLPISFSRVGTADAAPVVFAGYGLTAPKDNGQDGYDSFVHLDVADKWVLVFRYLPERISPKRRQHLARYASLRYKAMLARDKGARGLILVSGPTSKVKQQLIRLEFDGTLSGASVPVLSVTDRLAEQWLAGSGKTLPQLQDQGDSGEPQMGFELPGLRLQATIDIQQTKRTGRNVLGRLAAGSEPSEQVVLVGAHVDHLGRGVGSSSLARDDEKDGIHFGADDNASGVAALLEIAQYLGDQQARGAPPLRRDILFAAWSGEELGLIGSSHFAKTYQSQGPGGGSLYPAIAACLNLDMVGRLDKRLILQGVGSSSLWRGEIERRNAPLGLPVVLQDDSYLPTDAEVFFLRGVPILAAFTGSHSEYHTPRDTPNTLNYDGAAKISRFVAMVARSLASRETPPDYVPQAGPKPGERRAGLRAYLGTIPDYAESDAKGVKLSGVAAAGPAAKAGVKAGDVIVELAGKKVENIYDYTYAIEALKIGQAVKIIVQRGAERVTLDVTPSSRE